MRIVTCHRFEFSAARRAGPRWRGDNFTAWLGAEDESFPWQAAGALFDALDGVPLGIENPTTAELARRLWAAMAAHFGSAAMLDSLALAEEDGDAVSVTRSRAWTVARGIFSAAHRTHAPALSDEDNMALYGKCDNPAGHGHNYRVDVWVPISPGSGEAARAGMEAVVDELDHKNLSLDIPDFRNRNVVTEAVAGLIAGRIPGADRVRVWETPDFFAEYRRGDPAYRLGRNYNFHAVHRDGTAIAGHNYRVRVVVQSPLDTRTEAAFDLGLLDRIASGILGPLDHSFLDEDVPYFHDRPADGPTLVRFLWSQFEAQLGRGLDALGVQPTPRRRFWTESELS